MGIKILTLEEAEKTRKTVEKYNECFEIETGNAKVDYFCDNSNTPIPKGTECAAVLVLPDNKHPNYEHQKNMLRSYLV